MVSENYLCPANHDFKQTARNNHVLDHLGQFNEKKKHEYHVITGSLHQSNKHFALKLTSLNRGQLQVSERAIRK